MTGLSYTKTKLDSMFNAIRGGTDSALNTTLAATYTALSDVASVVTANGALVISKHNPVDATSGNLTMTLADATGPGQVITVEKTDATINTVTISPLHLRNGGAGSVTLVWSHEAIELRSKADGSWWPVSGHKTKSSLDATYVAQSHAPLNAMDYGAVGDGSADDTTALQNLLNAAFSTRRAAYIPRGRYKITASLTVTVTDATKWAGEIRIYGDGSGFAADGSYSATVIEPTNAVTDAAFIITGLANSDNSNKGQIEPVISDLGIRGVSGGTNGEGFRFKYLTNLSLRNVKIAYCNSAIKIQRQANGATYGYANGLQIDNLHAVANRAWGIDAADAGAMCGLSIRASNFGQNGSGGIKIAPGPSTLTGNIYTGNNGPALRIMKPTDASSNATGPTCIGEHFESNGGVAASTPYSSGSAQVVIEYAQSPRFIGCLWLGSTNGENDIMAGYVDSCTGLTIIGGAHFGKSSVAAQAVVVVGPSLTRCNIDDTEASGYSGSSSRATSAQMFKATSTDTYTYAHLAADSNVNGALTASTGVATVLFNTNQLPVGCHGYFEISSQGGTVYAYGIVRVDHSGASIVIQQTASSADCSLSIVSGSLRVTQTNSSSLQLYWSLTIVRTI